MLSSSSAGLVPFQLQVHPDQKFIVENAGYKVRQAELESKIESLKVTAQRALEKMVASVKELELSKAELKEWQAKHAAVELGLLEAEERYHESQRMHAKELQVLQQKIGRQQALLQQAQAEVASLSRECGAHLVQLADLKSELAASAALKEEQSALLHRIAEAETRLKTQHQQLLAEESKRLSVEQEKQALKGEVASLTTRLTEHAAKVSALSRDNAKLRVAVRPSEAPEFKHEAALLSMLSPVSAGKEAVLLQSQIQVARADLRHSEAEKTTLYERIAALEAENKALRERDLDESAMAELDYMRSQFPGLMEQLGYLQAQLAAWQQSHAAVLSEGARYRFERDMYRTQTSFYAIQAQTLGGTVVEALRGASVVPTAPAQVFGPEIKREEVTRKKGAKVSKIAAASNPK